MDYKTGYTELFNAITKVVSIIKDDIINKVDKEILFDGIPKGVFDVMAILQTAQQHTEELYMWGEESREK